MKVLKWVFLILLTPPFLVCSVIIANSLANYDWGSVPDWFSFIVNACTVIITLKIAIRAKKFLDEKVHSEGLARGYKILDSIDEIVDVLPTLTARVIRNTEIIDMASKPEENHENYSLESALKNSEKIYHEIIDIKKKINHVENMLMRIGRWHIEIKHPNEFQAFIKISTEYFNIVNYIIMYNLEIEYPDSTYSSKQVSSSISTLSVMENEVLNHYKIILELKFKDTFTEG
jgi:hypothetical protein